MEPTGPFSRGSGCGLHMATTSGEPETSGMHSNTVESVMRLSRTSHNQGYTKFSLRIKIPYCGCLCIPNWDISNRNWADHRQLNDILVTY